ncbi:hypothetical protein [Actinomyces sp.]|uniref:hypothetical protein n=1 Tax=Actinomyces sp. TaxID=29317 RepID=UPI0026DB55B5|nr:hypothetical protein [Actinomyces sp.]MDO4901453.1 hypothetical protein [Actinomyces sp.]
MNRRRFALLVAGSSVAISGFHWPEPSAHASTAELIIGPAAIINGLTVLRVAATSPSVDLLTRTRAFTLTSKGYTPSGIRLLSLKRGIALRPLAEQPEISATAPNPGTDTVFVAFDGIEGDEDVEVKFPGLGLIGSVPVLPAGDAPFRLA